MNRIGAQRLDVGLLPGDSALFGESKLFPLACEALCSLFPLKYGPLSHSTCGRTDKICWQRVKHWVSEMHFLLFELDLED